METVVGFRLEQFPLHLNYVVDLIYCEGALLSLFENEYGDYYLYYWCDVNDLYNRWLVFRVTKKVLSNYLEGLVCLRDLVLKPIDGIQYLLDIDNDLEVRNTYVVQPNYLPQSYIPSENSYYSDSHIHSESFEEDKQIIQQNLLGLILSKETS